jgi:hypothetical protein
MREWGLRMQLQDANRSQAQLLDRSLIAEEMLVEEAEETREAEDPTSLPVLEGECVLWTGATHQDGRGIKFLPNGKVMTASRWLYIERNGLQEEDIKGYVVSSACSNRRCVNPKHLYLNRNPEWRFGYGSFNPRSKLTDEDVRQIRIEYREDNARELMERFGITRTHLSSITNRRSWKHVK